MPVAIPFAIPAEHMLNFATGGVQRYGAILKDTATGKIVGHVQETRLLGDLLQTGLSFDPTGATGLIGVVQNAQISSKLTALQQAVGTLQSLQLVNIASSVAGIGVTAASTAMILHRLDGIGGQINRVEAKMDGFPDRLRELGLRDVLTGIRTTLERLDNAANRLDPEPVVRNAEEKLHYGFDKLLDGVQAVLAMPKVDTGLLRSLLAGVSLCGAAQIKALFWLNELAEAEQQAKRQFQKIEALSLRFPQDVLAHKLMSADPGDAFATAAALSDDMAEIRARVAALPALSNRVAGLGVHGRDYLERLSQEEEQPLLILPAH